MGISKEELSRALAGDSALLRSLVDQLIPAVHCRIARYLFHYRRSFGQRDKRQELDDLCQEAFRALFANDARILRSWDPARGMSLTSFVALAAEREIASILRTTKRCPWTEDPTLDEELASLVGVENGAADQLESRQFLETLMDRLRCKLSPLALTLFHRIYVLEDEVPEICEDMNLSPDAVYAWRSRLAKVIRQTATDIKSEPAWESRTDPMEGLKAEERPS